MAAGKKAVVAALCANLFIASAKFVGYLITGAASMLAETIHSLADAGNQGLLLLGGKLAKRRPTDQHQFGYGRERYFWAFVVAIVLFSIGGLFALYEGIHKLEEALHGKGEVVSPAVALGILFAAIIAETLSFRTAILESRPLKGSMSWWQFVRRTRVPELSVILLEDLGALLGLIFAFIGVGLAALTDNVAFDAIGSIAIGLLLIVIAIILAIEQKSLLIGESADPDQMKKINEAVTGVPSVERLIHVKTLQLGPDELLVAAKIQLAGQPDYATVAQVINETEQRIRASVPEATLIFLEPDQFVAPTA